MTIIQLETFLKISELKSFTLAANDLGYAQSTVTMQIKQLEEELGCELFERLGKTIVLTSSGEKLRIYAERLLQLEREIYLEVPESDEPAGLLKIGVSESLCYNIFPRILMDYKKRCPKINIRLSFVMHDTFPELLKKGELDLVYTLNPHIEDENLTLLHEQREFLGFYASPAHELAAKKINEKDLNDVPMLLTSHNCSFRNMFLSCMKRHDCKPDIVMETSSKEILKVFSANGFGVALMPDMTAVEDVKRGSIVKLNWVGDDLPIYSQLFVHKDKRVTKVIGSMIDSIVKI
jgi:DNA-binding transcriptional LysR family regulator